MDYRIGAFVFIIIFAFITVVYLLDGEKKSANKNSEMLDEISHRLDSKDSIIAQRDFEIAMLKHDIQTLEHYYAIGKLTNSKGDSVGYISTTR